MAHDITVANKPALNIDVRPAAVPSPKPAPAPVAADRVFVSKEAKAESKPVKPAADAVVTAPGEDVRNKLSVFGMVAGPVVMLQQAIDIVGNLTFKNPLFQTLTKPLVHTAGFLGRMPLLSKPLVQSGLTKVGRALPFLGVGILAFDGYAAAKTLTNDQASSTRKWLTAGRFGMGVITAGLNFIPRVGMVAGIIPGLIGNVFEFALMKRNAQGKN